MIIKLIDRAVDSGARLKKAAAIMGLSARTIIRWRQQGGGQDQRKGPLTTPANKLSNTERQKILDTANSAPFRDLSPKQIVPKLGTRVFTWPLNRLFTVFSKNIRCSLTGRLQSLR